MEGERGAGEGGDRVRETGPGPYFCQLSSVCMYLLEATSHLFIVG